MRDRKSVAIVGEFFASGIAPITLELLNIGKKLALTLEQEIIAVFIGTQIDQVATEAILYGADKVYVIDNPLFKDYVTGSYVAALEKLEREVSPELLLLGHTSLGKDLAPRLAFRLKTGITLDCIDLYIDPVDKLLRKVKPVYGGNAIARYVCEYGRPQMATLRPKVIPPAERDPNRKGEIISFDTGLDGRCLTSRVIGKKEETVAGVKLEDAKVVICGGRGLGGPEPFKQLEGLAKILGGAVGATRPPCDAGWCPSSYQIGLTGKFVSPQLYIGVALSGSSQHQAGMSSSKAIVAINKDREANIFNIAHYGVVGEYEKVLPTFINKLKELSSKR